MSIELVLGALRDASSQDHLRIKAAADQLKQWEVSLIKQALFLLLLLIIVIIVQRNNIFLLQAK